MTSAVLGFPRETIKEGLQSSINDSNSAFQVPPNKTANQLKSTNFLTYLNAQISRLAAAGLRMWRGERHVCCKKREGDDAAVAYRVVVTLQPPATKSKTAQRPTAPRGRRNMGVGCSGGGGTGRSGSTGVAGMRPAVDFNAYAQCNVAGKN
jgi:hypothetical protein